MKTPSFLSTVYRFDTGGAGLEVSVNRAAPRLAIAVVTLTVCSLLVFEIVSNFIVGVLTDERVTFSSDTLAAASGYYANSPRLHARLAAMLEQGRDPARAEESAFRATRLSPFNYNYRVLLAAIRESRGDIVEAEQSLRAALALAPNKTEVHWQLANVLLRQTNLDQAIGEFNAASRLNPDLLPVTLNLVWRASGGNLDAVDAVTNVDAGARLALAQFLLKQGKVEHAADVFGQLQTNARLVSREAGAFLNDLIAAGHLRLAHNLWSAAIGDAANPLISNGSFEAEIPRDFAQFNWITYNNDYAEIRIGKGASRTGARSLRIDFVGRDTTRLDGEIKQAIVVRPGARYRIDCYANAGKLVSPEGPRIAVTTSTSSEWIGASEPVAAGETGWQHMTLEFTAPRATNGKSPALFVAIKRRPRFSYDEPTRGTVYFDDFMMTELVTAEGKAATSAPAIAKSAKSRGE
jgi:tetratricopeptide (TPR) repeat protein